jgi:hypothetical protein
MQAAVKYNAREKWTPEEDEALKATVATYGAERRGVWVKIAKTIEAYK